MANGNVDDLTTFEPDTTGYEEPKALEDAELWDIEVQKHVAAGLPQNQAELKAQNFLTKKYGLTMEDAAGAYYLPPEKDTGWAAFGSTRTDQGWSVPKGKTLSAIKSKKLQQRAEQQKKLKGLAKAEYDLAMKEGRLEDAEGIRLANEAELDQQAASTLANLDVGQVQPAGESFNPLQQIVTGQSSEGVDRALLAKAVASKDAFLKAYLDTPEIAAEKLEERDRLAFDIGVSDAALQSFPRVDDRKDSPRYGQMVGDFSDAGWELKKLIDEQNAARSAAVENFELDLGGSLDGKQKMIAAISLIIGGIGAGLAGGANMAAAGLDKHIERDIKRQMLKQKSKIQNLDLNQAQQREMFKFTQQEQLEAYKRQVDELALKTADLRLQEKYHLMGMGVDQKIAELSRRKYSQTYTTLGQALGKGAKQSTGQEDASIIQATVDDLSAEYENMLLNSGGLSRWVGHFAKDEGFLRSFARVTGMMDPHTGKYLNKATMAIAKIVKTLQGSRPSDFDWKKLATLIPGTRDDPDLARADFQAIMEIAQVTAMADMEFAQNFGGVSYANTEAGKKKKKADYESTRAGHTLMVLGEELEAMSKGGETNPRTYHQAINRWQTNVGAVLNTGN